MNPSPASPGGSDNWTCDEMTCWVLPLLQPLQCNVRIEPKLAVGPGVTDDDQGNNKKKITGTFLGGHLSTEVFILCHCEECSQLPGYKWIESLPTLQDINDNDNDNPSSPSTPTPTSSSSFFMPPIGIPLVANGIRKEGHPFKISNAGGGPIWTASQWEKHSGRGRSKKWKESTRVADGTDRTTLGWIIDQSRALEMDHHGTLVGKRVAVYFVRELAFYTGKVVAFRKDAAQHWIKYDDGDNEWLDLGMEHFFILDTRDNDDNVASGDSKKKKDNDKEQKKEGDYKGVGGTTAAKQGREKIRIKPNPGNSIQKNKKNKNKIVPAKKKKAIVTPSNHRKDKEPASKEPHVVSIYDKTSPGRHNTLSSSDLENGNDYENENEKKGGDGGFITNPSIGNGGKGITSKRKRQNDIDDNREEEGGGGEDGHLLQRDEDEDEDGDRDEEQSSSESSVVIEISSEESDDDEGDDGGGAPRFRPIPLINSDDEKKKNGGNSHKREMDPELLAELEEFLNFKKVSPPLPMKAADNAAGGTGGTTSAVVALPTTNNNEEKEELVRARIREEVKEEYALAAAVFDENQAKSLQRILNLEQELARIKDQKKDSDKQKRDVQKEAAFLRRENDRLKREVAKENERLKKALTKSEDQVKILKKELIELGNDHEGLIKGMNDLIKKHDT
jgi:hypothetical protein